MSPDRWKATKELFEAALSVPANERSRFLDERCAGDADLRREVESLLDAHTESGDFLDRPAAAAESLGANPGTLVGQQLGPYHVSELIGEGGMGAVYLARDERLKRRVAIKTLHSSLAWDTELIERLRLEARAESAINHPNICTVYDVGEWKGVPYIVMEYLEGESLRAKLKGRPLEVDQIAEIGAAVADALAAAHAKGIIHRDVKPGNIFLCTDGQIKIMDFGVAKKMPRRGDQGTTLSKTAQQSLTRPWVRIGTVTHMSPEQARGETIDGRSDLFSLGSVLYEMTTGHAPFRGDGPQAVMDAIISGQPRPPTHWNPAAPRALEQIIHKALEKDVSLRYQTAGDLAADLRRFQRDASSGRFAVAQRDYTRRWVAGGAAVAVASAAWLKLRSRRPAQVTSAKMSTLAALRGIRESPSISPDGGRVAFSWTGESGDINDKEIYVQFIGTGRPLKLTDGPGRAEAPVWSHDGLRIGYLRLGGGHQGYYTVPALGGPEEQIGPAMDPPPRAGGAGGTALDFSPDGKNIVIADREGENGLRTLFRIAKGERHPMGLRAPFVSNPSFSPDGAMLAFTMGPSFLSHDIYVIPAEGGTPRRLTSDGRWIAGITWTGDGSRIVFASRKVGPFSLWSVPSSGGPVEPVPQCGMDTYAPNISHKNNELVFARTKHTRSIWRARFGTKVSPQDAKQIVLLQRTSFQPDYSPDGLRIVFASDNTGSYEIWLALADSSRPPIQLTYFNGPQTGSPRWSPDGHWIVFDSRPDGHSDIHLIGGGGGTVRRLTEDASDDRTPLWSADGTAIFFVSNRSGRNQLWRMPKDGGAAVQITDDGATFACIDPKTRILYYTNGRGLWQRDNEGAGKPELIRPNFPLLSWKLFESSIYWSRADGKGMHEIARLDLTTREDSTWMSIGQRSTDFDTFTISPDGAWLLYDHADSVENELVLVQDFK